MEHRRHALSLLLLSALAVTACGAPVSPTVLEAEAHPVQTSNPPTDAPVAAASTDPASTSSESSTAAPTTPVASPNPRSSGRTASSSAAPPRRDSPSHSASSAASATAQSTATGDRTLPAGTDLQVALEEHLSSKDAKVGDKVHARVLVPVYVDGVMAVPAGAETLAVVSEVTSAKAIGGAASLALRFESLQLPDGSVASISAKIREKAKNQTGKDVGTIAGATAGGAILGDVLTKHDKTKGSLIGAAIGAAVGTGAAALTRGQEVDLSAGTILSLHLSAPALLKR